MNKSSFVSSQEDKNVSSFLNQSYSSVKKCCQYRNKYEESYRQLSLIRMQYRNLKQEQIAMKNSLKGVQQESNVLKSILNNKKQIINKLNYEIRSCNQEINRLEDELAVYHQNQENYQAEREKMEEEMKEIKVSFGRQRQEVSKLNNTIQKYENQMQRVNQEHKKLLQKLVAEKQSSVNQIRSYYQQKIDQLNRNISSSPTKYQRGVSKRVYKVNINDQNKILSNNLSTNINSFDVNIAKFKQKCQQKQINLQKIITKKDNQIEELQIKIKELQSSLGDSIQLFESQMKQMQQMKQTIKEKQSQNFEINQNTIAKSSEREQMLFNINKRLSNLMKNSLFCDHIQVIDKLAIMMAKNPRKFEVEITLKEIQTSFEQKYKQSLKNTISSKQYESINRKFGQLSENYELLMLKYSTLQREYNEILDDNNRLIRYNNLTSYRVKRNVSGTKYQEKSSGKMIDRTPYLSKRHEGEGTRSSNKENIYSTVNQ